MGVRVITPPDTEPVTLDEAKAHLRLETDADDTYVTALITAARQHVEAVCWCGIVTQTLETVLESFPCGDAIWLRGGVLTNVSSVKFIDTAGAEQTLSPSAYSVDDVSQPGRVVLGSGSVWPSTRCQWDAVRIRYAVGWAQDLIPAPIKQAVLLLVSQMYEHRTPEVTGTIVSPVKFAVDSLLAPYRLTEF